MYRLKISKLSHLLLAVIFTMALVLSGCNNPVSTSTDTGSSESSWTETILHASDGEHTSGFGISSAVSGNYAVVGSYWNNKAYIFEKNESGKWTEKQILIPPSYRVSSQYFGNAVAIEGTHILVGDYYYGKNAVHAYERGEDGVWVYTQSIDQNDNEIWGFGHTLQISGQYAIISGHGASVYFYELNGNGTWELQIQWSADRYKSCNPDGFGVPASISDDYAMIGGVDTSNNRGVVYVFKRSGDGTWNEVQILTASDEQSNDFFGNYLCISGSSAVIASWGEDGGDGDPILGAGAAYVFELQNGSWVQTTKLVSPNQEKRGDFGRSVAIYNDTIVVGAAGEDKEDESGESIVGTGSAYVYKKDSQGTWPLVKSLIASDFQKDDQYGCSISMDVNDILIGAFREDGGVGDPWSTAGAIYAYKY